MAVDGGWLGRATNPSDYYSSHNNVKHCSWGMPGKGQSLFHFPFKVNDSVLYWHGVYNVLQDGIQVI